MNSHLKRATLRLLAACLLAPLASGCSGYLAQSLSGQLEIMRKRQAIDELVADPATDTTLRDKLEHFMQAREFAIRELGLPDSGSFRTYVELGRRYPVWNVVATPEFSLEPRQWCYPLFGCFAYRGYFKEEAAREFARELAEAENLDINVGGVTAYSTLGWFKDPLLSSTLRLNALVRIEVLFHELAHEQLYLKGDTAFNEAYASVVAEAGMRQWLASNDDEEGQQAYARILQRERDFNALLRDARAQLQALYRSRLADPARRVRKQEIFAQLRGAYLETRQGWDAYSGYDWWFERELNNAHLAAVATYQDFQPALRAVLAECADELACLHDRAKALGKLSREERHQSLSRYDLVMPDQ